MDYIAGQIHDSFQKEHFYLINLDFVWINCDKRYSEFLDVTDWDNYTSTIDLKVGDIISVRFFKTSPNTQAYCYLEKVISDGVETLYKTESTISLSFLEHNLDDGRLFINADKLMKRDKKLQELGI